MESTRRILKAPVIRPSIRVEDPAQVEKRRGQEVEDIVEKARKTAEKILADSFEAIRKEREAFKAEKAGSLSQLEQKKTSILAEYEAEAVKRAEELISQEFRPRVQASVEAFEALVRRTEEVLAETLDNHSNEVVDLALALTAKIVDRISDQDKELAKRTTLKCIEAARERQEMIIRVNPGDLEALEGFKMELIERFDDLRKIRVEADRRVDCGGAWIETPTGFIDGRIRSQLDELFASVLPDTENPQRRKEVNLKENAPDDPNEASPNE